MSKDEEIREVMAKIEAENKPNNDLGVPFHLAAAYKLGWSNGVNGATWSVLKMLYNNELILPNHDKDNRR